MLREIRISLDGRSAGGSSCCGDNVGAGTGGGVVGGAASVEGAVCVVCNECAAKQREVEDLAARLGWVVERHDRPKAVQIGQ